MKTAEYLKASGEKAIISPTNGNDFTLLEMQGHVGGYIEILNCKDGRILIVDEEGRLKGLPLNTEATLAFGFGINICGNAILCERDMVK